MNRSVRSQPLVVKETYLDVFGHMNNATYLTLFEQARWDFLVDSGYGLQRIQETGFGPIILDVKLCFLRELRVREIIVIETELLSYEKKIGRMAQRMLREDVVCCTAEYTFGLFDLTQRKLVLPTSEWSKALRLDTES